MNEHSETAKPGIHVLAKPIGPVCDIKCDYCFYLEKRALFASDEPYKLGNVLTDNLGEMVERSVASGFGPHKERTLPRYCRECEVKEACWGGCPKHRFATTPDGEPGLHYLCAGYKKFFRHIRKYLRAMTTLLENDMPVSYVMQAIDAPLIITRESAEGPGPPS